MIGLVIHGAVNWGKVFTVAGVAYKYAYRTHKGKKYRRKFKRSRKGKWVAVGVVAVLVAAAWTPASGFSWLFRMAMR